MFSEIYGIPSHFIEDAEIKKMPLRWQIVYDVKVMLTVLYLVFEVTLKTSKAPCKLCLIELRSDH